MEDKMCNCTLVCDRKSLCEIGNWVKPNLDQAIKDMNISLIKLGPWLFETVRSIREVLAFVFESENFINEPARMDRIFAIGYAMDHLGFKRLGDSLESSIWNPFRDDINLKPSNDGVYIPMSQSIIVRQRGELPIKAPYGMQRVLEFMVYWNSGIFTHRDIRTSEVAGLLFPDASAGVLSNWLIEALDDCLFRVGYTPMYDDGKDEKDPFGDPEWFCDGDPRDSLRFNLWKG